MRVSNLFLVAIFSLITGYSHGAISLSATRIIYNGSKKDASINIINSNDRDTVIQTWLEGDDVYSQAPPFAVTPPLAKIKGNKRQLLRVIYQGVGLPQDRESVFWLNVQEIPLKAEGGNVLQLALMQRIKVFYRPTNLQGESYLAPERLKISIFNNQLVIKNPTPFYINMVSLSQGRTEVNGRMLPPASSTSWPIDSLDYNGMFTFSAVNDFGAVVDYSSEFQQGVASPLKLKKG